MSRENKARYAILGILSSGHASGYDIKKNMEKSTNHFWGESDSSIYPALKKLYEDKCVTCKIANEDSGKPKKVYAITKRGQLELEIWLQQEPERSKRRNELLLKIFFGWNVPSSVCIKHIQAMKLKCEQAESFYQTFYKKKAERPKNRKEIHQLLTLRNGILLNQATIKWCDEALEALHNEK